jgi:hypothetical protein
MPVKPTRERLHSGAGRLGSLASQPPPGPTGQWPLHTASSCQVHSWGDTYFGGICDRTTSMRGSSTRISLSDSRWSENTINTHKYNTNIHWSLNISYYNLGLHFKFTKVEAQKMPQRIKQSLRKRFLSCSQHSLHPRRECHPSVL